MKRIIEQHVAIALTLPLVGTFGAGGGIGLTASQVIVSEQRAEVAAVWKMQQRHPGHGWSVTHQQLHILWSVVSDTSGQSYGSPWTPCSDGVWHGPLAQLRCPPPPVWAIELAAPSDNHKALVVVDARSGVVLAVLSGARQTLDPVRVDRLPADT